MLVRSDMPDGPESGAFLQETRVLAQDVVSKQLQVVALSEEV